MSDELTEAEIGAAVMNYDVAGTGERRSMFVGTVAKLARLRAELASQSAEVERLRATDLMRSNVMGRIAIVLFDERNNVTDEQCVERLALVKKVSTALYAACRAFAEWANANPLLNDQREGSEFSAVYNAAFDALELAAALAAAPEGRPQ